MAAMSNGLKAAPWWRRRRWLIAVAVAVVAVPLVVWGVVAFLSPGSFELYGRFTLGMGAHIPTGDGDCAGSGGYRDIGEGTQVTVSSPSGEVLAVGALANSLWSRSSGACLFTFTIPDVPGGHDIYQVEVSHRGTLAVREDNARAGRTALTLG